MPRDDENLRGGEPPSRRPRREREPRNDDSPTERRPRRRRRAPREELPPSDLRDIAFYQRILILCIMALMILYVGAAAMQVMAPRDGRPNPMLLAQLAISVAVLVAAIASTVFVFLLATKAYNVGIGILLGILTLLPCIGIIVLLIINSQATSLLQRNGIRVGFLGAQKRTSTNWTTARKRMTKAIEFARVGMASRRRE